MSVYVRTSPWLMSSIVPERRGNLISCILQACSKLWRSLRFCSSLVSMAVTSFWSWVNSLENTIPTFVAQTERKIIFHITWHKNYLGWCVCLQPLTCWRHPVFCGSPPSRGSYHWLQISWWGAGSLGLAAGPLSHQWFSCVCALPKER